MAPVLLRAKPKYPNRQIRLVIGFAPGGAADVMARLLATHASMRLGQSVIVDNRPGASAIIAADNVAKSPADGYTLFVTFSEALIANAVLYRNLPYKPQRDFATIAMMGAGPLVIAINKNIPAKNLREFVAYAQNPANRSKINWGSWGTGSHGHLLCEAMNKAYKLSMAHVPFRGEGPAIQDLVAGQIQIAAGTIGSMSPHLMSGSATAIGTIGKSRAKPLPDVPTLREQGATDDAFAINGWVGLVAPATVPREIISVWADVVRDFLAQPVPQQRFAGYGFEPNYLGPDAFAAAWAADVPIWTALIRDAGVTLD
jgi:tripartite-type tricarboxylate transporter receptor subunit TctC